MTGAISGHDGTAAAPMYAGATANSGICFDSTSTRVSVNGSNLFQFSSGAKLGLQDNGAGIIFGGLTQSANTPCIFKTAHNVLGQYNSTTGQTYELYNTRTDGSNYERAAWTWESNICKLKSEAAGTGTQRAIHLPAYFLLASASDVSPASTTGEQDLSSVTVPAGTLATNGDKIIVNASAILTSNNLVALGTFHLDIDGTEAMVSSDAPNQGSASNPDTDTVVLSLEIVRESTTSLRYRGVFHNYNDTAGSYEQVIVTGVEAVTDIDSNSFTIVSRGTPDGATTDVIQKTMDVQVVTQ